MLSSSYVDSNMVSTRYYLLVIFFFFEFVLLDSFYLEKVPCPVTNAELGLSLDTVQDLATFSPVEVLKEDAQKADIMVVLLVCPWSI